MIVENHVIPGSHFGDSDKHCYIPVFVSEDKDQRMWYFGNRFLEEYYTVFDMTPHTERGENYIQVGFAKQKATNLSFEPDGGDKYDETHEGQSGGTNTGGNGGSKGNGGAGGGGAGGIAAIIIILLLLAVGGGAGYWYWKKKKSESIKYGVSNEDSEEEHAIAV